VARQRLQHVIEETNSGPHVSVSSAIQLNPDVEIGFVGFAADLTYSGHARSCQ